jgi:hypothetical protein
MLTMMESWLNAVALGHTYSASIMSSISENSDGVPFKDVNSVTAYLVAPLRPDLSLVARFPEGLGKALFIFVIAVTSFRLDFWRIPARYRSSDSARTA